MGDTITADMLFFAMQETVFLSVTRLLLRTFWQETGFCIPFGIKLQI